MAANPLAVGLVTGLPTGAVHQPALRAAANQLAPPSLLAAHPPALSLPLRLPLHIHLAVGWEPRMLGVVASHSRPTHRIRTASSFVLNNIGGICHSCTLYLWESIVAMQTIRQ